LSDFVEEPNTSNIFGRDPSPRRHEENYKNIFGVLSLNLSFSLSLWTLANNPREKGN